MNYFIDIRLAIHHRKPYPSLPTIGRFNKARKFTDLMDIAVVGEDNSYYMAKGIHFKPTGMISALWQTDKQINKDILTFMYRKSIPQIIVSSQVSMKHLQERFPNLQRYDTITLEDCICVPDAGNTRGQLLRLGGISPNDDAISYARGYKRAFDEYSADVKAINKIVKYVKQ